MNRLLSSNRTECSVEALSKRLLERPMKLSEVAELYEKCNLQELEKRVASRKNQPFTFVVPAHQLVASISRFVE